MSNSKPSIQGREMVLPTGLKHILPHTLVRARLNLDTHPKFADEEAHTGIHVSQL